MENVPIQEGGEVIVSMKDVSIYQRDNLVLQDVNVEVHRGEFVFLIGKNGSGKSSFLKTLYSELKLNNGEATVTNFSLRNLKRSNIPFLRRKIGIVFQDFQLLTDRTVMDNLLFVLKATGWEHKQERGERIRQVLEQVGLEDKAHVMPHELSGGEQQRVAIARALLNEPDLILADEPTGNLDPHTSDEIMKLLFEISQSGKAIIMASHNYELMKKYSSRVIKCHDGRMMEEPA